MIDDANITLELVSKHIHNMWTTWAKNIIETEPNISKERKERWQKECFKPYEELSESMKQLDRNFAVQIIEAITNERTT
ncbi:hypothetical protein HNV08_04390 [Winogradskyella eckloniae]|nr:hypothetical protein [Winogradskyella eckloniae]